MIALYIILSILSVLLILLSIPVHIKINYAEEVSFTVQYLFLKKKLTENKEESEKTLPEKSEEKKPNPAKEYIDSKGLRSFLRIIKEIVKLSAADTYKILKHIKVAELDIYAVAGGENAAEAAMLYGESCSIVYPAVNILKGISKSKNCRATVDIDYSLDESKVKANANISIRPIFAVTHGIHLIVKLLPYLKEFKVVKVKGK